MTDTLLRGPADADHYRIKVGRYGDRWYTDPLPGDVIADVSDWQGPSYSIVKGASGKDWSFVSLGRCADDMAAHPTHYENTNRDRLYDQLTSVNKRGLNVAAGRGTITHYWFEDLLAGKPMRTFTDWDLDTLKIPRGSLPLALDYQQAIGAFFDHYQPELAISEIVCIDRDLNGVGYGCTGDAGLVIEGDLLAADWKSRGHSSEHGCYPEEAAQVGGAFAGAQYCIIEGAAGPERAPIPAFDGAIIVSVHPTGCRIYPINLTKARTHFEAMHAWWVARKSEREAIGKPWPPHKNAALPAEGQPGEVGPANSPSPTIAAPVPAVEQPAGEAADTSPATTVGSGVARTSDVASSPPTRRPVRKAKQPKPDEGDYVELCRMDPLKDDYKALPDQARHWVNTLVAEGNAAGVPWNPSGLPGVRRYELGRAIVRLADAGAALDDIVLGLLEEATGRHDDTIPLGHALGTCNFSEATIFAELVDNYLNPDTAA